MAKGFAFKLAISNIKNNRKLYLPYVLASIGMIMMFYIMCFLSFNKGIRNMAGADALSLIMRLGCTVLGIFAIIFILYIDGFLMKRRKREIGLYNILGMEKKHIGKIMFMENLMTSILSILMGVLGGVLFSKLVFMLLAKSMKEEVPLGFEISKTGVLITGILFCAVFFVALIKNQMSIALSKPIELLHGSEAGEKEPKSKGVLAIIGFLCLGIGYYIGITTKDPLEAIFLFFIAVLLVIAGTYILFVVGSVTILKALKKNKKFYYKPNHFTAVSGMIYRMKQNAVGLANICVLSTMVLVMISTTVCLRVGMADYIESACPTDVVSWYTMESDTGKVSQKTLEDELKSVCKEKGVNLSKLESYSAIDMSCSYENGEFVFVNMQDTVSHALEIITAEQYEELTGEKLDLANNQVIAAGDETPESFQLGSQTFQVKSNVDRFLPKRNSDEGYYKIHYLVVASEKVFNVILNDIKDMSKEYIDDISFYRINLLYNIDASKGDIEEIDNEVVDRISSDVIYNFHNTMEKEVMEQQFYGFASGFLFLGIFLGIVFTFAAALIIYYKQISEGYYDKGKFEIMQKVGMSNKEVKRSIKTQVLMVFFAPLVMAACHMGAAFNLIKQLLLMFGLSNANLFLLCTLLTFAVFALIYGFVYSVTAREYYKIVQHKI